MAVKKFLISIILIFIFAQIIAFETENSDSIFVDSIRIDTLNQAERVEEYPYQKRFSLEEIEQKVLKMEDSFCSFDKKLFPTRSVYQSGNNFLIPPFQPHKFSIFQLDFNNHFFRNSDLLRLANYYNFDNDISEEIYLLANKFDFEPTMTTAQFSSGSHNYENRYLGFQKNNFYDFCDVKLFLHSGKNSGFSGKNYFDNLIFQIEKKILSHKINFHFLKLFSKNDNFDFSNQTHQTQNLRKFVLHSQIANISLFNDFINLSYLHQDGLENISGDNKFSQNQTNLHFHFPFENYETDISLKADFTDYDYAQSNISENVKDYYFKYKMKSPGFFADFYSVQIWHEIFYSDLQDTIFYYPRISLEIPINNRLNSEFQIGTRNKKYPISYFDSSSFLYKNIEVSFADLILDYHSEKLKLKINPFIQQIENEDEYNSYGISILGKGKYDFLFTQNELQLNFNFTKNTEIFAYRPNILMKILWKVEKDLKHNNFIFSKLSLSYLKDFYDESLDKKENEIFFDFEFGFQISRFRISLLRKNLLNQNYFLDEANKINTQGTYLQIHWNFIN